MLLRSLKCLVSAVLFVSPTLVAQSLSSASSFSSTHEVFEGTDVKGLPYSLVEKTTRIRTLADGTTISNVNEERHMRDAEGRRRIEVGRIKDGELQVDSIEIIDPVARTRTTLFMRDHVAHLVHLDVQRVHLTAQRTAEQDAEMRDRIAEARSERLNHPVQSSVEKLSAQTIQGVFAEGTRMTRVIPEGSEGNDREITVVTETWFSPELKITLARNIDDPRIGKTSMEVSELVRSDPDPALFQVPSDFKVVDDKAGETAVP